jgi:hypothetical protein
MSLIEINKLSKHFKVLNRREGLRGAFLTCFPVTTASSKR